MSGPGNVLDMVHQMAPRDTFVLSLVEGFRHEGKQATPATIANVIRGATGPKVAQVLNFMVKIGAAQKIGFGYAVTPAGIAAMKFLDETYEPSDQEEQRRGRVIPVPGRDEPISL